MKLCPVAIIRHPMIYLRPKSRRHLRQSRGSSRAAGKEIKMPVIYHYLVKSGDGYFIIFENGSPLLTTDFVEARRFHSHKAAQATCDVMRNQGFGAKVVKLRHVTLQ